MIGSDYLAVKMKAAGVQLMVRSDDCGPRAEVWSGEYPAGQRLSFTCGDRTRNRAWVGIDSQGEPDFWIGATSFDLPWHDLLKVADYLHLEIPLPHPLPGDEPAAEASA